MAAGQPAIPLDRIGAVVFDTDGVVIDSARVHAAAWKRSLDEFLRRRSREMGTQLPAFDVPTDYLRHLHGRPHVDGVRAFLASRGIALPDGGGTHDGDTHDGDTHDGDTHDGDTHDGDTQHGSTQDRETVHGIAARTTHYFLQEVDRYGVAAFRSAVALVRELRGRGARIAAVSSSPHCARVLAAARVQRLFDLRVDGSDTVGVDVDRPEPGLLLETAHRLDLPPRQVAVVGDSLAAVEAARRTGFGLVVAVAREPDPPRRDWEGTLRTRGAQIVVRDLGELGVLGRRREPVTFDP
jgi:HAD superfamily hydrolase (TIGR01509 family)